MAWNKNGYVEIVLPFMNRGDLKSYLLNAQQNKLSNKQVNSIHSTLIFQYLENLEHTFAYTTPTDFCRTKNEARRFYVGGDMVILNRTKYDVSLFKLVFKNKLIILVNKC